MPTAETQAIIDQINGLTTTITALDAQLKAYTPSLLQDLCPRVQIHNAAVDFETQVAAATDRIRSSPKRDSCESLTLKDPLAKMATALSAFLLTVGATRPRFSKALLGRVLSTPFCKGHLDQQQRLFNIMLQELSNVTDPTADFGLRSKQAAISTAFDTQINVTYATDPAVFYGSKIQKIAALGGTQATK